MLNYTLNSAFYDYLAEFFFPTNYWNPANQILLSNSQMNVYYVLNLSKIEPITPISNIPGFINIYNVLKVICYLQFLKNTKGMFELSDCTKLLLIVN